MTEHASDYRHICIQAFFAVNSDGFIWRGVLGEKSCQLEDFFGEHSVTDRAGTLVLRDDDSRAFRYFDPILQYCPEIFG